MCNENNKFKKKRLCKRKKGLYVSRKIRLGSVKLIRIRS